MDREPEVHEVASVKEDHARIRDMLQSSAWEERLAAARARREKVLAEAGRTGGELAAGPVVLLNDMQERLITARGQNRRWGSAGRSLAAQEKVAAVFVADETALLTRDGLGRLMRPKVQNLVLAAGILGGGMLGAGLATLAFSELTRSTEQAQVDFAPALPETAVPEGTVAPDAPDLPTIGGNWSSPAGAAIKGFLRPQSPGVSDPDAQVLPSATAPLPFLAGLPIGLLVPEIDASLAVLPAEMSGVSYGNQLLALAKPESSDAMPIIAAPPPAVSRVRITLPDGLPAIAALRIETALRRDGFSTTDLQRSRFATDETVVRFYHDTDAETARRIATEIGGKAQDFSGFAPLPPDGSIEIWVARDRA